MRGCTYAIKERVRSKMDVVVDKVLADYSRGRSIDVDEARKKMTSYFRTLSATRKLNERQLASFGLAYLRELYEGPDPEYSGM